MTRELRIVSVCRLLPTPDDPSSGIFVLNRLAAMRAQADLRVIQQIPFFPGVKPRPAWARAPGRRIGELSIAHAAMFYTPGVLKTLDSYWLERAVGPLIERLHRERPLDAIDAHFGYPEGVSCVRIARRLGVPVFITLRGFETEYVLKKGIGGQLVAALRTATGCVSVSHSLRKLALSCGVPPERVRVVHNAIDAQVFNWGDAREARARLGFPQGRPLVVSVGHLIARKRHHVLLDAFASVRRAAPHAELAIIGGKAFERTYPDELVARARSLGVLDATRFLGNLPPADVADWLRAADVFALATAREGCCNAVLEALAAGVPVVTTDVGDNAAFVRNGVNGHIVPVDDAAALAQGIESTLRAQEWDRRRISRDLLNEVGSWEGVATRALDFMRERIGHAAAAAAVAAA